MVDRCILHIGMHKTGSSSIQDSLYGKLSNREYEYLDLGKSNHSELMCRAFVPEFRSYTDIAAGRLSSVERRDESLKMLRDKIGRSLADTVIISAEELTRPDLDIVALTKFLMEYVNKVEVVGYVRPPHSLLESGFQEILKTQLPQLDTWPYYKVRLARFDIEYGCSNVHLWKFSPAVFRNGCVVTDFCDRIGVEIQNDWIVRANESLSKNAVSMLYIYRVFAKERPDSVSVVRGEQALLRKLMELGGVGLKFSHGLIEPILWKHRDDMHWVEERLGGFVVEPRKSTGAEIDDLSQLLDINPEMCAWLEVQSGETISRSIGPEELAKRVSQLVSAWGGK